MTGGTGKYIGRNEVTSSGGKSLRLSYSDPNNPSVVEGYLYPLEAELTYTNIGTCASGRISLSDTPGWAPWQKLIRIELHNNSAWEVIFLSTHDDIKQSGNLFSMNLISLWDIVKGGFRGNGSYPQLGSIVQGSRIGLAGGTVRETFSMTWEQYYRQKYEAYETAQWGYSPDGFWMAGRPEDFTPLSYTLDKRTLDLQSQGYSKFDYLTAVKGRDTGLLSDNDYAFSRDLGLLVPRRVSSVDWDEELGDTLYTLSMSYPNNITASNDYCTIENNTASGGSLGGTVFKAVTVELDIPGMLAVYDDVVDIDISIEVSGLSASHAHTVGGASYLGNYGTGFTLFNLPLSTTNVYVDAETQWSLPMVQSSQLTVPKLGIDFSNTVEYPFSETTPTKRLGELSISYKSAIDTWSDFFNKSPYIYGGGTQYPDPTSRDYKLTAGIGVGTRAEDSAYFGYNYIFCDVSVSFKGRKHADGWVPPPDMGSNPYGGPTYRLNLVGAWVGPMQISGLPNGLTQYAAGATVRVNSERGLSTELLTKVLPTRRS